MARWDGERSARILPTRNGNFAISNIIYAVKTARILPTRNGNQTERDERVCGDHGTDPTYKEWKLLSLLFLYDL